MRKLSKVLIDKVEFSRDPSIYKTYGSFFYLFQYKNPALQQYQMHPIKLPFKEFTHMTHHFNRNKFEST